VQVVSEGADKAMSESFEVANWSVNALSIKFWSSIGLHNLII